MKGQWKKRKAADRQSRAALAAKPLPKNRDIADDSDSDQEATYTNNIDRLFAKVTRRSARDSKEELRKQRAGIEPEEEVIPYYGTRKTEENKDNADNADEENENEGDADDEGDEGEGDEGDEADDAFSEWKARVMSGVANADSHDQLVKCLRKELKFGKEQQKK